MNKSFTNDGDKLNIDCEPDCNTLEIWNDDRWNTIILTDAQLADFAKFLTTVGKSTISDGLDKAIKDELNNKSKDIMR